MRDHARLGHLLAGLTILIWGTTFISTKMILRELSPVAIFYARFAIALLCLLFLRPRALRSGKSCISPGWGWPPPCFAS